MIGNIKERIAETVDEIFLEKQKELNITSGDIDPWDAVTLDKLVDDLGFAIFNILKKQKGDF